MIEGAILTPDLVARAVIASARAYGDCPVRACLSRSKAGRRGLVAAAGGLARALGAPANLATHCLGLSDAAVRNARIKSRDGYAKAELAAMRAVEISAGRTAAMTAEAPAPELASPPRLAAPDRTEELGRPRAPRVLTARAVQREIRRALELEPSTGPDLMEILDLAEGQVRAGLLALKEADQLTCDPMTQEGWSAQFWRLKP